MNLREVAIPHAGAGQIRVRVTAAGLNPMDWFMTSDDETAGRFGLSLPCGFGTGYAGVVDQVGDGVTEFAAGDRVFGGVSAAIDLHGTKTVQAAPHLGVPDQRITTIAGQVDGITPANGADAAAAVDEVARLVAADQIRVPIAASYTIEQIRDAVELQSGRHVHGKIVIDL